MVSECSSATRSKAGKNRSEALIMIKDLDTGLAGWMCYRTLFFQRSRLSF